MFDTATHHPNNLVTDGIAFARRDGIANHNLSHEVVGDHVHILNCSFDMVNLFAVVEPHTSGYAKVTKTSVCRICNPDAPKTQREILADLPAGSTIYRHPDLGEPMQVINPDETFGYSTVYPNGGILRHHVKDCDIWFADGPDGHAAANALILSYSDVFGLRNERYGFAHTSVLDPKFLADPNTTVIPMPEFIPTEDTEPWPRTKQARMVAERFRPLALRWFATRHLPAHDRKRYDLDVELKQFAASLPEATAV